MKKLFAFTILVSSVLFTGCKKEKTESPANPEAILISNLAYNPTIVTIKDDSSTFIINGTFSFKNATGGVASLKLTTSAGADMTFDVPTNNQTEGILTGIMEIATPATPGSYTFALWIIDKSGKQSNKLAGSIQVIIDDSGKSWRFKNVPGAFPYHKVIIVDSKYFAVGTGIISSQNGADWSLVYNPSSTGTIPPLYGITKSTSKFVAVGQNKTVVTSTDGINWIVTSSGIVTDYTLNSVVWTGTQFIAVGCDVSNNKTEIVSSVDGASWIENNYFVTGGVLNGIAKSNNLIVAVGTEFFNGSYHPMVITTINGIDWTKQTFTSGGILNDIIWTGNKFVAVGTGLTAVSIDGSNWIKQDNPLLILNGVTYSGNNYVSVGAGIYTSSDATTWTKQFNYNDLGNPFRSVAWSGHQYVVVGYPYVVLLSP